MMGGRRAAAVKLEPEDERGRLIALARAAGMYPRNLAQAVEAFMSGKGVRATAEAAGISKNTATRLFGFLTGSVRACGCGRPVTHSGWCASRLAAADLPPNAVSATRTVQAAERRVITNREARRARVTATLAERHELAVAVNRLVPRFTNDDLRGEVTQEIFLAIATGEMTLADVPGRLRELITRAHRGLGEGWVVSLDAPVFEDVTRLEMTAAPSEQVWEESDEWDFDTHCFGCGERGFIRRICGHWQCTDCGCIIQTCCDL